MLKNRSLNVKVVKDVQETQKDELREAIVFETHVRTISKAAILVIATYMASSTLRAVLVHVVATKIT